MDRTGQKNHQESCNPSHNYHGNKQLGTNLYGRIKIELGWIVFVSVDGSGVVIMEWVLYSDVEAITCVINTQSSLIVICDAEPRYQSCKDLKQHINSCNHLMYPIGGKLVREVRRGTSKCLGGAYCHWSTQTSSSLTGPISVPDFSNS